jgi:hypothetical protein
MQDPNKKKPDHFPWLLAAMVLIGLSGITIGAYDKFSAVPEPDFPADSAEVAQLKQRVLRLELQMSIVEETLKGKTKD